MQLVDIQRRIAEAGRIRIGEVVPAGNGKTRPAKLDTFRLTSADKTRIEQAARLYGGEVSEWTAPAGKQWQVTTAAAVLNVIVPPSEMAFSQAYEIWSAGGCQRRCDGAWESISDAACLCDPEERDCDIHTRLSVMLRDLPGLGLWRIDTQGYYAATELSGAVQIIAAAAGRGALLPARLVLQQRSVIRRGADGKPQTRRFAVPVLDIDVTPGQLIGGAVGSLRLEQAVEVQQIGEYRSEVVAVPHEGPMLNPNDRRDLQLAADVAPGCMCDEFMPGETAEEHQRNVHGRQPTPNLTPVPRELQWPVSSVADQVAEMDNYPEPKPRSNAAQPVRPTDVEPRTLGEALKAAADQPTGDIPVSGTLDFGEIVAPPLDPVPGPTGATPPERIDPGATSSEGTDSGPDLIPENMPDPEPMMATPTDQAWIDLAMMINQPPTPNAMKVELRERTRRLYGLMETVGLWKAGALRAALRANAETEHITELNKAPLLEFAGRSWAAAESAFRNARD